MLSIFLNSMRVFRVQIQWTTDFVEEFFSSHIFSVSLF